MTGPADAVDPIRLTFPVACPAAVAFTTWTTDIGLWWPRDHTRSGDPAAISFEAGVGGRVVEHTRTGDEVEWGRVVAWDPPGRLAYLWYLGGGPEDGTDVEVTFTQQPDGTTVVELVHTGWERLGERGRARRDGNLGGWSDVIAPYLATFEASAHPTTVDPTAGGPP